LHDGWYSIAHEFFTATTSNAKRIGRNNETLSAVIDACQFGRYVFAHDLAH